MNEIYVYHNLGMGDHISCHGIVRHFSEVYDKVILFVKEHNFNNVKRMYMDIKNIEYIIGDDDFVENYIKNNNISNLKRVGVHNADENLELQFYKSAGLPIEYKYTKFYVQRDYEKELELFNYLKLEKNNYIFFHDGGFQTNNYMINKSETIVRPNSQGIFDWLYVIENAKEIHCIDSAFICLVDCMDTKDIPLYNHRVRGLKDAVSVYPKKNWIKITK
jgi:hypothetical protein